MNVDCTLNQPLTPPQCRIIVAYRTLNHGLAIATGRYTSIPISRDTTLYHFRSYNAVKSEAHFVLECPKFPSLFESVVLESLESFFQLDHQVDISLYLTEVTALRHSKKIAGLKPS